MNDYQTRRFFHMFISRGWSLVLTAFISQASLAHNQVVVIPMGGEDAISHPVAKTYTNSIGMRFNQLPAGRFSMGTAAFVIIGGMVEPGRNNDEVRHNVTLSKAFNMQITEVTNAQWNDVIVDSLLGVNPSTSHPGDNNYPVETISWFDAVFFANRLSQDEGKSECYRLTGVSGTPGSGSLLITTVALNANCIGYRLPTEAEWEYAARAGTTKAYANPVNFDNSDTEIGGRFNGNLHAMGWYIFDRHMNNQISGEYTVYEDGTKPVAKKQANAWGLYDMHGNVSEWAWDWYAPYTGNVTDPVGPASGDSRVRRSGSFGSDAQFARSACRSHASPGVRARFIGFRLVLSAG